MKTPRPELEDVEYAEAVAASGCGGDHALFVLVVGLHHRVVDLGKRITKLESLLGISE